MSGNKVGHFHCYLNMNLAPCPSKEEVLNNLVCDVLNPCKDNNRMNNDAAIGCPSYTDCVPCSGCKFPCECADAEFPCAMDNADQTNRQQLPSRQSCYRREAWR